MSVQDGGEADDEGGGAGAAVGGALPELHAVLNEWVRRARYLLPSSLLLMLLPPLDSRGARPFGVSSPRSSSGSGDPSAGGGRSR